jgi:hypothetical protein
MFLPISNAGAILGQNLKPAPAPNSSGQRSQDVNLAKISLGIVFVFIVCHSLKWIPNIYELIQVCCKYYFFAIFLFSNVSGLSWTLGLYIRDDISLKISNVKLSITGICKFNYTHNLIKKLIKRKLLFHLVLINDCTL